MTAMRPSGAPYGPEGAGTGPEAGPDGDRPPQEPSAPCLFCDRANSEILGESASWYIRLDNYPAAPGHVELVTKRHVESLWGLDGGESAELYGVLAYARNLVEARFGTPDGWTIGINEGRAAGRSVDHLHVHLIPRHHGDVPDPRGGIRRGLPNGNPDAWGTELPQGDTALRERLVRALARTVYRDDNPPPHIARICEPWADDIATEVEAWAAEQTQRARDAPPAETECPAWAWHACACPQQCDPEPTALDRPEGT